METAAYLQQEKRVCFCQVHPLLPPLRRAAGRRARLRTLCPAATPMCSDLPPGPRSTATLGRRVSPTAAPAARPALAPVPRPPQSGTHQLRRSTAQMRARPQSQQSRATRGDGRTSEAISTNCYQIADQQSTRRFSVAIAATLASTLLLRAAQPVVHVAGACSLSAQPAPPGCHTTPWRAPTSSSAVKGPGAHAARHSAPCLRRGPMRSPRRPRGLRRARR